jgi:hypothetical protein
MFSIEPFEGFALQSNDGSQETIAITTTCSLHKIPYKKYQDFRQIPALFVPSGNVDYCQNILNKVITPDYYPDFLKDYLYRKVYRTDSWSVGQRLFIKPADKYKRFTGFITNRGYKGKKHGPYWCSDVVKFENEWRYYVANGLVLSAEWYSGDEVNTPDAPILNIRLPLTYCGALDFGMLSTGELALVESQHPFACGWYGKDHIKYVEWLVQGWKYMLSINHNQENKK